MFTQFYEVHLQKPKCAINVQHASAEQEPPNTAIATLNYYVISFATYYAGTVVSAPQQLQST